MPPSLWRCHLVQLLRVVEINATEPAPGRCVVKPLTLRLDDDDHAVLELIARIDGASLTDVLRRALREHAERRLNDPDAAGRVHRLHVGRSGAS